MDLHRFDWPPPAIENIDKGGGECATRRDRPQLSQCRVLYWFCKVFAIKFVGIDGHEF